MKFVSSILASITIALCTFSCTRNQTIIYSDADLVHETSFFGDSTLTIVSSNKPNGYQVKIFQTKDLILMNLTRGDSINQYVPLDVIPRSLFVNSDKNDLICDEPFKDRFGTYVCEINIPIEKEKLRRGIFFMDVNFDEEEELLVEYPGYNRIYFACFDLVNGIPNITPGILHAMKERPYNNIVSSPYSDSELLLIGTGGADTQFDYTNKTIHISESLGCCSYYEELSKLISDHEWEKPLVKVVYREEVESNNERQQTKIYERVDGELVLTEIKEEPWD